MTKILVAMSGGVDSSVAAAILKDQGHDLIGVTLNLACTTNASDRSCCSAAAALDAKKVADQLGFPHYVINLKDEFKRLVIDDFINEYRHGRTPNPCIRCNQLIKFGRLLEKADELGAEKIASGHYARIEYLTPSPGSFPQFGNQLLPLPQGEGGDGPPTDQNKLDEGSYSLLKGGDPRKDQSYVLYRLDQNTLARTIFPLGKMKKDEVRKLAKKYKLPVAEKPESQEICFIEDDDYGRYIREHVPEVVRPGKIVDVSGVVVGEHQGVAFFTIGQRKGIGHHRGAPKYVVAIDPVKNLVVIGDNEKTKRAELSADQLSFVSGTIPATPLKLSAKIRYNASEMAATLLIEHGTRSTEPRARVIFDEPQRAVTPGQAVVFYSGDEVLGGAIISS